MCLLTTLSSLSLVTHTTGMTHLKAKEWWHSAFRAFCFELHASASSAFHNKQQSLFLCLGAKILPRGHLVSPRIRCTWSSLLKSSAWTKEGHPLRTSSCTFSHPSLNNRTHFLNMPSLIALSPYTSKVWWWISLGSTFVDFKNRITDLFHSRRPLQLSQTCLTHKNKHKHNSNFTKWRLWLLNWWRKSLHMCKGRVSRMRERYAQTVLTFWINFVCNVSSNVTAIASHASVVYILSLMMLNRVLKLVGFTVKKETGKDIENAGRAWGKLRSFENRGVRDPQGPKKGSKNF